MAEVEEVIRADKLARKIGKQSGSSSLIGLQSSSVATASFTLGAFGDSDDYAVVTMTLENIFGLKLFAVPDVTFYKTSVTAANAIPGGASIDPDDFKWSFWTDWGATDNNAVVLKAFIQNLDASPVDIIFKGAWRFLLESGSVS